MRSRDVICWFPRWSAARGHRAMPAGKAAAMPAGKAASRAEVT